MTPPSGRIITFYSYKGGVGRTLALADVALILARRGHRVLCVDWDLEAPGLATYFKKWGTPEGAGLLDLIHSFSQRPAIEAAREGWVVPAQGTDDRLRVLHAGAVNAAYVEQVQRLNWDALYADGFGTWLEDLRNAWQWSYDYVLIDSRTGVSDIGGICTVQLPHVLVTFVAPSQQGLEGTRMVAAHAGAAQQAMNLDRPQLRVLVVPSRMDSTEYERRERWFAEMVQSLGDFLVPWEAASPEAVLRSLAVPYVPFWSYGEDLPVERDAEHDRLTVRFAHERLATVLEVDRVEVDEEPEAPTSRISVMVEWTDDDVEFPATFLERLQHHGVDVRRFNPPKLGTKVADDLLRQLKSIDALVVITGASTTRQGLREAAGRSRGGEFWSETLSEPPPTKVIPIFSRGISAVPILDQWLKEFSGIDAEDRSPVQVADDIVEALRSAS